MADKNVRSFRTSMSGYNKSDVLSYIDKMNADYRVEENRHNAALSDKDRLISELEKKCEQFEWMQAELNRARTESAEKAAEAKYKSEQLEKSEAVIASQTELVEDYRKKLEECNLKLEECNLKLEECERERTTAVKTALPDDYEELVKKAGMYDGISAQLGEILITANKSADSILSESNEKAALVTANAEATADAVKALISENVVKISSDLQESARTISADYYNEVTVDLMELRDTVATTLRDVSQRAEQLSAKTEYIKSQFDKELESALSRLDTELYKLSDSISSSESDKS